MNWHALYRERGILFRAQAGLLAWLYVFLCTFGTLTHAHAPEEGTSIVPIPYASSLARTAQVASRSAKNSHASLVAKSSYTQLKAVNSAHCAFCDWEANSVARIVLPLRIVAPESFARAHILTSQNCAHRTALYTASRAPPLA